MATLLGSMWEPAPRRPRGSALGLVLSLVSLVAGGNMLLTGLLLPSSRMDASTIPRTAVSRAATLRFDRIRVTQQVTEDSRLRFMTTTATNTTNRPERAIGHDPN